jgi:hypothetical protein
LKSAKENVRLQQRFLQVLFPMPRDAPVIKTSYASILNRIYLRKITKLKLKSETEIKYRHLFFDLDHTLWDFDTNSRQTLEELFQTMQLKEKGVEDFDLFHKNYLVP